MRLIDAEALKELFNTECAQECDNCNYYENCKGNQYCGLIDKAQTVSDRYDEGYARGYVDCSTGADMRGDV